jgi:hypothetical protein
MLEIDNWDANLVKLFCIFYVTVEVDIFLENTIDLMLIIDNDG